MSGALVVTLLTLLLGIQPVTTDLYLPALPALPALPTLQLQLGASVAAAQATLSVLIICFGFSQLLCGPLSDRFGRRPVLLAGLALYTPAAIGAADASSIAGLIAWRGLQGVAMAPAVTCGRGIVRDLFEPAEGARVMSRALTGNWRSVVGDATFRAGAAVSAFSFGGVFCMLAGSSFVFIRVLGVGRAEFGAILASISVAYIVGTFLCRRLLRRHGLRGAVARGACFSLAGGAGLVAFSVAGVHTVWTILLPQYLYAIGHGIHQPCGQAGAVGPFPEEAGTAASLSGFAMTVTALAAGLWLDLTLDGTVFPMTFAIGAFSVAVALVAWTLVQRHGEPARTAPLVALPRLA